MKILHTVESYLPAVHGMSEVVKQISENLVGLGHEVAVATKFDSNRKSDIINGVKIVDFNISGNGVFGYQADKTEIDRYQRYLIESDFDIITNFAAQQWATDLALPILDKLKAKKVFVPTGFSSLYDKNYGDYFDKMKNWLKQYDMNVFLSNDYRDINFARENGVAKIKIIPNGASQKEFMAKNNFDLRQELQLPRDCFVILTVGSHSGLKGHKESMEIFLQAAISRAAMVIIANGQNGCYKYCLQRAAKLNQSENFKKNFKKIFIRNFERPQTVAAYKQADLFLFPSNIECSPIVLFEAMAGKLPFLVTDVGNSKEIIKWSGGGLLIPTEKGVKIIYSIKDRVKVIAKTILRKIKFLERAGNSANFILSQAKIPAAVKMVEDLFANEGERLTLALNGFCAWREKFTWEKISQDYADLYSDLLKK